MRQKLLVSAFALTASFMVAGCSEAFAQMMSQDTFGNNVYETPAAVSTVTTTTKTMTENSAVANTAVANAAAPATMPIPATTSDASVASPASEPTMSNATAPNVVVVQGPPIIHSTEPVYDNSPLEDAEPVVLEPQTQGGVTFVAGGVGMRERKAMQQVEPSYNVKILNADKKSLFVGGVNIVIHNHAGATLLSTDAGPILLAKLPAGSYSVTAMQNGKTQTKKISVGKKLSRSAFIW